MKNIEISSKVEKIRFAIWILNRMIDKDRVLYLNYKRIYENTTRDWTRKFLNEYWKGY